MKSGLHLLIPLIAVGWAQGGLAQPNPYTTANRAVQIAQAREANAALMHQYTWNSRTEIISQGQVKDIRIDLVNYGPYGQLQRTLLNDQGAALPGGFLRRAIAEHEKEKMQKYLTGLQGLLEQYTLPTTGKILDFMTTAKPAGPDANGWFQLTGQNVVQPGDNLTIWVDPWTKHPRRVHVNTTFEGDAAQLTATYNTLPSGLSYVAYAEVTVPGKQLSVQVQNFNYTRPN